MENGKDGDFRSLFSFFSFFFPLLLQGSPELIEPNIFTADWHGVHLSSGGNILLLDDRKGKQNIINFYSGIYISNKVYGTKAEGIATPRSVFKDNKVMLTILIFWFGVFWFGVFVCLGFFLFCFV